MNKTSQHLNRRSGFSIAELMVGMAVALFAVTGAIQTFVSVSSKISGGTRHMLMVDKSREVQQQIARIIERARAVGTESDRVNIVMPDLTVAKIQYVDGDNDPETLEDNVLEYDPDVNAAGQTFILCDTVTPITGEAMFQTVPTSPHTVLLTFHVGYIPPSGGEPESLFRGRGYEGVEVRAAATPRNGKGFIH